MSASMSSPVSFESTRRRLTTAQAETVNRLTAAAVEVLREVGYDALTVRSVAKRAGVAPATAYTYFSSKGHVVAELFWRRLAEGIADPDPSLPRTERVVTQLRSVALAVEDDTHLARAVTASLLGSDPDVEHLRLRIGVLIRQRLATALGGDPEAPENEALLEALEMLYSGALVRAGMGYETYSAIADRLDAAARLLLENR
ncbi:TetR family transcriptional regulator [Williamsia sp. D3]|uniref:TetR family transcriptional regulator n=2 Tax=Williamsia marianensis TaxID=85044 RepID=A0A315SE74_WILMA|nr:TetR family transcriptional regulator [Williamsia sp. D3]PVY28032.1 TetR family transcriptional regulator [Williamsia marianensis]RKR94354.1 TetR family transcriptional regulator [Williamsia muralis]